MANKNSDVTEEPALPFFAQGAFVCERGACTEICRWDSAQGGCNDEAISSV